MKTNRQAMIVAIIKEQVIGTQEDLGEALKNRGILVTQATLSRDIKELGLIKVPTVKDITAIPCLPTVHRGIWCGGRNGCWKMRLYPLIRPRILS